MTIVERPSAEMFTQFLIYGGSVQFVIESADVDPNATTLPALPLRTQLHPFQIPRDYAAGPSEERLNDALETTVWIEIERLIARRGGTITYRLLFPGFYLATCLIASGKLQCLDALTSNDDAIGYLSAAP